MKFGEDINLLKVSEGLNETEEIMLTEKIS